MLHLPVRRLLDLVYALAAFRPDRRWEVRRPRVKTLTQQTNETEKTLVNWRDGTKRFALNDFERVWPAMFGATRYGQPKAAVPLVPVAPLFVAATIFQVHCFKVDPNRSMMEVWLDVDEYFDWWRFHERKFVGAKDETKDASPWPDWLSQV
jgi:hypothetical protein